MQHWSYLGCTLTDIMQQLSESDTILSWLLYVAYYGSCSIAKELARGIPSLGLI